MKTPYILIIILIVIFIAIYGIIYLNNNKPTACTAEAKICPDGTAVSRTGPDCEFENCPSSKICESDKDCVVFGKDGDCNCGCYNENALPQDSGGACFCAAPASCKCVSGLCEPAFG